MDDIPWKAIFAVGGGIAALSLVGIITVWGQDFIESALNGFGF